MMGALVAALAGAVFATVLVATLAEVAAACPTGEVDATAGAGEGVAAGFAAALLTFSLFASPISFAGGSSFGGGVGAALFRDGVDVPICRNFSARFSSSNLSNTSRSAVNSGKAGVEVEGASDEAGSVVSTPPRHHTNTARSAPSVAPKIAQRVMAVCVWLRDHHHGRRGRTRRAKPGGIHPPYGRLIGARGH